MPLLRRGADAGAFAQATATWSSPGERCVSGAAERTCSRHGAGPNDVAGKPPRHRTGSDGCARLLCRRFQSKEGGQQRCCVGPLDTGRPLPMSPDPLRRSTEEIFWSFVQELARTHDRRARLSRLRRGHYPDCHGWCGHPEHECRWQRYPCQQVRLADLVDQLAMQQWHPIWMWRGRLLETQLFPLGDP